jgi:hypothetical protein
MGAGMVLSTRGPNLWLSEAGWPLLPGFCREGLKEQAADIGAGHFPHHHGVARVTLSVVKLDLSELATERASSWDRPRDHVQDGIPSAG